MAAVFEMRNVSKQFGKRVAMHDVSLRVEPGVIGLLGPNGSGKSTLIKTLLGLVRPDQGNVEVLGLSLPSALRTIRDRVGFVPEDDCYLSGLTGVESAQAMARMSGLSAVEALRRSHEVLDFADMGQERYRTVEAYSTGMRQKLKFAQALVHDPSLLILDEPTAGLDPNQRRSMLHRIRLLASEHGKTILLSTHILHDVNEVCDWVIILSRGSVRRSDSMVNLSRPVQPGLCVRTVGDAAPLIHCLRHAGYEVVDETSDGLSVLGIDPADPEPLWRMAGLCHTAIRQLQPASNSLEKIFLEAVRESHHAAA